MLRSENVDAPSAPAPTNRELLAAHLLPYLAYIGALTSADLVGRPIAYGLAALTAGSLLWAARRRLRPLRGPRPVASSVLAGLAVGGLATALWIALKLPFVPASPAADASWPAAALAARAVASIAVVPWVEEHLMRGFVLGVALQWQRARARGDLHSLESALDRHSIHELEPGACSWFAGCASSVVFALGHAPSEWIAAFVYGGSMAALYAARRDLLSCVVAHATTNAALAVFVTASGRFELW